MTAGLRYQARVASYREERARALYEFARDMSSLLQTEDVVDAAREFIANTFRAEVAMLRARRPRPPARCAGRRARRPRDRRRRRAVGVRQVAAGRRRHRHAAPGASSSTCRCARRCARAACSRSGPRNPRRAAGARAAAAPRHVRRTDRDRARARPLRRSRAAGADPHGIGAAAQLAAVRAVARPAHAARGAGRPGRIAGADAARRCPARSSRPRRPSPTRRGG